MGLVFEIEKAMTFVLFIVRMSRVLAGVNRLNDIVGNYKGGKGIFFRLCKRSQFPSSVTCHSKTADKTSTQHVFRSGVLMLNKSILFQKIARSTHIY